MRAGPATGRLRREMHLLAPVGFAPGLARELDQLPHPELGKRPVHLVVKGVEHDRYVQLTRDREDVRAGPALVILEDEA